MTAMSTMIARGPVVEIRRSPQVVANRRAKLVTHLINVPCSPFDPVSEDIILRLGLQHTAELKQTFVESKYDIKNGDYIYLPDSSRGIPIRYVGKWEKMGRRDGNDYLHIILEVLK